MIRMSAGGRVWAPLALAVLALVWGCNWVVMKIALRDAGPLFFAAARMLLGALSLFVVMALSGRSLRPGPLRPLFLLGLLQTTGFIGFSVLALVSGRASQTVLIAYTMPFWTLLFARIWMSERLQRLQWLAIGTAFFGLMLVISPWTMHRHVGSDVEALVAALCWSGSVIVAKRIPEGSSTGMLSVTAWQMLFGVLPLATLAVMVHEPPVRWTPYFIVALTYNALMSSALAWLLWLYVVRSMSAAAASLGILLVPVVGAVAAAIDLHERPPPLELGGMVLICAALALLPIVARRGRPVVPLQTGLE